MLSVRETLGHHLPAQTSSQAGDGWGWQLAAGTWDPQLPSDTDVGASSGSQALF